MDEKTLKVLIESAAVKRVRIIAHGAAFHIEMDTATNTHVISTRQGKPRQWRTLDAGAKWLHKLGLGTITLDLTHWQFSQRSMF